MSLFAGAEAVLGQAGSGSHNALFARPGMRVGSVRFIAPAPSTIAALNGHRIAYLTEGINETAPARFRADPERFRRLADALINQP